MRQGQIEAGSSIVSGSCNIARFVSAEDTRAVVVEAERVRKFTQNRWFGIERAAASTLTGGHWVTHIGA